MHRAGGEPPTLAPGKRVALHHMIVAGDRGYARGATAGSPFTTSATKQAEAAVAAQLVAAVSGRLPRRCRFRDATWPWSPTRPTRKVRQGPVPRSSSTCARRRTRCRSRHCRRRPAATSAAWARSPAQLHENRPGSFQSEETIFATCRTAGVRDVRHPRSVRAEGNRVVGAADAEEADRPAAERRTGREVGRHRH